MDQEIHARLGRTWAQIHAASPHGGWCVGAFTLALVVRSDPERAERFTSGSTGQYVGRTCLVNPTAPGVDDAVLAEALVHEAIHSVLYMQERARPWVHDTDVYFGTGYGIASPWTTNKLTPRQFMQACFVWYGLYRFWTTPGVIEVFGAERAARLARDARKGFYGARLVNFTGAGAAHTDPLLLAAIDALQKP